MSHLCATSVACRVCGCEVEPYTTGYDDDWDDTCESHPICVLCAEPYDEDDDRASADGACPECAKSDAVECPQCGDRVVDLQAHGCDPEWPGTCEGEEK